MGYKFTWEQGKCYLCNPNGAWTQLAVRNYVPFLEQAASLGPGSDDELWYAMEAFAALLGADNPELPHVLEGVSALWPAYVAAALAGRKRMGEKGPIPQPAADDDDDDAPREVLPQAPAAAEREDPPMGPSVPRRRHRLRYEGALEFDPTAEELLAINRQQVEAWIPKDHWMLHLQRRLRQHN